MLRIYDAGWKQTFHKFDMIPNRKTDTNNHGPMSTDNIGMNYDYPEATYERRKEILNEHRTYHKVGSTLSPTIRVFRKTFKPRCRSGAYPKTNFSTTDTGRIKSTSVKLVA